MEDDEGDELDRWLDEFGIDLPEVDDAPGDDVPPRTDEGDWV